MRVLSSGSFGVNLNFTPVFAIIDVSDSFSNSVLNFLSLVSFVSVKKYHLIHLSQLSQKGDTLDTLFGQKSDAIAVGSFGTSIGAQKKIQPTGMITDL